MAYDSRCYELAEIFLEEEPQHLKQKTGLLAQHIQDAIEDWIKGERDG